MVARLVVTNNLVLKGTLLDQTKKQPKNEVIQIIFIRIFVTAAQILI